MSSPRLRIHHFETASRANGPGLRAVIWLQGCTLACPNCFNPGTHSRSGGIWMDPSDLVEKIMSQHNLIEGITISGGEPLQQMRPLIEFLKLLHSKSNLSVLVFSGYNRDEIQRFACADELLKLIDVLIAGRYIEQLRVANGLMGSSNKTIEFLTSRYSLLDLETIPQAEIVIAADGEIRMSGIDPLKWV